MCGTVLVVKFNHQMAVVKIWTDFPPKKQTLNFITEFSLWQASIEKRWQKGSPQSPKRFKLPTTRGQTIHYGRTSTSEKQFNSDQSSSSSSSIKIKTVVAPCNLDIWFCDDDAVPDRTRAHMQIFRHARTVTVNSYCEHLTIIGKSWEIL